MVGHETRLAICSTASGSSPSEDRTSRVGSAAGVPVAGLRLRGDASRAQGAAARERVLALLSRARARVQQLLQLLRRDERRRGRALPEGRRDRPPADLEDGLQRQRRRFRGARFAGSVRGAARVRRRSRARLHEKPAQEARQIRNAERKAFDTLGLEIDAAARRDQGALQGTGEAASSGRQRRRPLDRGPAASRSSRRTII